MEATKLLIVPTASDVHTQSNQMGVVTESDEARQWIAYPHWQKNFDAKYLTGIQHNSFELIRSVDMLHTLNSPMEVLSNWYKVLKVGGTLSVSFVPDEKTTFSFRQFDSMLLLKLLVSFCYSNGKILDLIFYSYDGHRVVFDLIKRK